MKKFIQKHSIREIVVTAVVIVCLLLFGLISLLEASIRTKLYDQQAADRWAPEGGAAQVSSFFAEGEIEDKIYFLGVRDRISKSLQEATITPENETARLWMDAISRGGEVTISYGTKQAKVEAIGVSGDFFDFHVMEFKSGAAAKNGESLWQRIKQSKIVQAIKRLTKIRIVFDVPALPEGKQ